MAAQNHCHHALQQALRTARQTVGLTQMDIAQQLGQPQSYVSKYEAGTRRLDLIELVAVCAILGIDVQELVEVVKEEMDRK